MAMTYTTDTEPARHGQRHLAGEHRARAMDDWSPRPRFRVLSERTQIGTHELCRHAKVAVDTNDHVTSGGSRRSMRWIRCASGRALGLMPASRPRRFVQDVRH